ncbi:colicin immunity domain-containing protein [Brevibacillus choshinensis]|uniref:colicin immunity domain-containing protein n=1 Tax=Brevibacillus choshinensis TaxID=54911 RepID=UPI002E1B8AA5|nr:colicin immunity domain-containing protein [Brevibacillus choshinensis]MED4755558.1 colicin immunity domain-containing protein [Brevibacillus choshinensis]MED4780488.1 colicin immunity domain-containing protein [Brevibacillus choshinensis]
MHVAHKYKILMEDFLNNLISVDEFENRYLDTFKTETVQMDDQLFQILNTAFESVDCYWKGCQEGEETPFVISEQQLRKEVSEVLVELKDIIDGA